MPTFATGLKRPVWIAHGTMVNGVRQYGTPVLHHWNWRGLSSTVGMMTFGPEYMDYRRAVTDSSETVGISQLDRVWLDTAPPETVNPLASTAEFYVLGVVPSAGGIADVTFKRLSHDD